MVVEAPIYDFRIHRRAAETRRVEPTRVVLVEGILIFAEPELRKLFDVKIFVDTDADVRLIRRIRRDIAERGRTLESVVEQYQATVRPMHLEFVEPSKRYADLIVPEGGENTVAMEFLFARARAAPSGRRPDGPIARRSRRRCPRPPRRARSRRRRPPTPRLASPAAPMGDDARSSPTSGSCATASAAGRPARPRTPARSEWAAARLPRRRRRQR